MKKSVGSKLLFGLSGGEEGAENSMHQWMAKSSVVITNEKDEKPSLVKSIINQLNGVGNIERLSFENDPALRNNFAGVYRAKLRLIPDDVLKRIAIQDSLVSNIVRARQNHVSAFGRPRPDRFSTGYIIEANTGVIDNLDKEGKKQLDAQIKRAIDLLATCGHTDGVPDEHRATFSEYLSLEARNAVVVGRIGTEVIWVEDEKNPDKKRFHHFVAVDAGTIYKATNDKSSQQAVRDDAYNVLCNLTGKKLEPEKYNRGEYTWVQVIAGRPTQVFTSNEMKVYNFYAVPDVELDGYPVTPIDTVITAVTTHINITTHNKLYFQSGRATRGMLIIKSDDAAPNVVHNIKQQFNASINNVNNSWRMPVFGCGTDEEISWSPIDTGTRDMEFQYLTDMNAREILTAFMMSPDELPGWSYLSRGTNNQALSESNNEYALEAARDVGITPLLQGFEDFINSHLLPLIDEELSKKAKVKLVGLKTDNAEKEAVRTQQDMGIWMTYDDVLERVEKNPIGRSWGGSIPLNAVYKSYLDQYFTVGEILEHFCDKKDASKDPSLAYRRDEFFMSWTQMMQAQQQAQQAAQQQAQQAQQGGGLPGQNTQQPQQGQGQGQDVKTEKQKTEASQDASASPGGSDGSSDLARSIDQAFDYLSKSESQLPAEQRRILAQQRKTEEHFMKGWMLDLQEATKEILAVAEHHVPKK